MTSSRESAPMPAPARDKAFSFGSPLNVVLVGVNLAGMLLYLHFASLAWRIPEEVAAGIDSVTGEPLVWAGFVFPIWAAFLLVNAVWVLVGRRRGARPNVAAWLLVSLGWEVSLAIDF